MVNILFVCMGNICRSPTAHAVMQHKVKLLNIDNKVSIDSAGTHAYHVGEKSDARSRQKAAQKGIDMTYIRARKIALSDFQAFDYILAMDEDNLSLIEQLRLTASSQGKAKVSLFLDYARQQGVTEQTVVPDPYYGGEQGFETVFSLVDIGCDALIKEIGAL